jgi:hypothetical protein
MERGETLAFFGCGEPSSSLLLFSLLLFAQSVAVASVVVVVVVALLLRCSAGGHDEGVCSVYGRRRRLRLRCEGWNECRGEARRVNNEVLSRTAPNLAQLCQKASTPANILGWRKKGVATHLPSAHETNPSMGSSKALLAMVLAAACLTLGVVAGIPSGKVVELTDANFDELVSRVGGVKAQARIHPIKTPSPSLFSDCLSMMYPVRNAHPRAHTAPSSSSCRWPRAPCSSTCTRTGADVGLFTSFSIQQTHTHQEKSHSRH